MAKNKKENIDKSKTKTAIKDKSNKKSVKNNKKNITNLSYEMQMKMIDEMTLSKKLFLMREFIDYVSLGLSVDVAVVDRVYEDLLNSLKDYEYLKEQYMDYLDSLDNPPEYSEENNNDILNNGEITNTIDSEIPAGSETPVAQQTTVEGLAQILYGKNYTKLIDGIDDINQDHGLLYNIYYHPFPPNNLRIKIYDDNEGKLIRWYENKEDLDENLEEDLNTLFKRKKSYWYKIPKLSPNKSENRE